jgi:hypothetical protein
LVLLLLQGAVLLLLQGAVLLLLVQAVGPMQESGVLVCLTVCLQEAHHPLGWE